MRGLLVTALTAGIAPALRTAGAAAYPDRAIRIVLPVAPGGETDNLMRMLAPSLSASLGENLVIDNKPGGLCVIGTGIVAKSTPDGFTALVCDTAILANPGLFAKLP